MSFNLHVETLGIRKGRKGTKRYKLPDKSRDLLINIETGEFRNVQVQSGLEQH